MTLQGSPPTAAAPVEGVVLGCWVLWGPCPPVGPLGELVEWPGSASRMVVEPGLQVARLCEIEQVFRQLL
jgi:hypothetical protein